VSEATELAEHDLVLTELYWRLKELTGWSGIEHSKSVQGKGIHKAVCEAFVKAEKIVFPKEVK
jgi:hypothetical protein